MSFDQIHWGITTIVAILALIGGRYWGIHDRHIKHDKEIFEKILNVLPGNRTIRFVKEHDFGGSFEIEKLDDFHDFFALNDLPDCIFVYNDLEKLRKKLVQDCNNFDGYLSRNSYPLDFPPNLRLNRIKPIHEYDDPADYNIIVNKIHTLADTVWKSYNDFVHAAIKKLH